MTVEQARERVGNFGLDEVEPDHPGSGVQEALDPDRTQPSEGSRDKGHLTREVPGAPHGLGPSMSS